MPNEKPHEIQCALNVIERMDCSDPELYESLKKALPILAAKLKQAKMDVNEAILEGYVVSGAAHIANEIAALSTKHRQGSALTYKDALENIDKRVRPEDDEYETTPEEAFFVLCISGELEEVKKHYSTDLNLDGLSGSLYSTLIQARRLDVFEFLMKKGMDIRTIVAEDYLLLQEIDGLSLIEPLLEMRNLPRSEKDFAKQDYAQEDIDFIQTLFDTASYYNYIDIMKIINAYGCASGLDHRLSFINAAKGNGIDSLQYLHQEYAVDLNEVGSGALLYAAANSSKETSEYLIDQGVTLKQASREDLDHVFENCDINIMTMMLQKQHIFKNTSQYWHYLHDVLDTVNIWKEHRPDVIKSIGLPRFAHHYNPHYYNHELVIKLTDILLDEGVDAPLNIAYGAAALFGTEAQTMRYMEKWAKNTLTPLFDVINMITLPRKGKLDLKSWGDAVMQHGPDMARFVICADELEKPMRSKCGRSWSLRATRDAAAEYLYDGGCNNPQWAKLCHQAGWGQKLFDKGTEIISAYECAYDLYGEYDHDDSVLIPDVVIDGALFDKPKYNFKKLQDGDLRGLVLGVLTDNCQHLGDAGAACAEFGFLSQNSGFYVIADKRTDDIVAQSWAWRGENGELVLDSLEGLKGHMDVDKWGKLLDTLSAIFQKNAKIPALLVGTDGETPEFSQYPVINNEDKLAKLPCYEGYSDAKDGQYVVYKI